jgi:hypothetical protein
MSKGEDWDKFLWPKIGQPDTTMAWINTEYLFDLPNRPNFNDRLLDAVLKFKGEGK